MEQSTYPHLNGRVPEMSATQALNSHAWQNPRSLMPARGLALQDAGL